MSAPPKSCQVRVDELKPSGLNPRVTFEDEAIQELADSISTVGLLQPIVARTTGDGLEILCGERRWRAAQRLGLKRVPAIVHEGLDDTTAVIMATTENLARRDLTAWETLAAYQTLREKCGLRVGEIAKKIGVQQASVSRILALARLPEESMDLLKTGKLNPSAGYLIASKWFDDPATANALARKVSDGDLSIRELEKKAVGRPSPMQNRRPEFRMGRSGEAKNTPRGPKPSAETEDVEVDLFEVLAAARPDDRWESDPASAIRDWASDTKALQERVAELEAQIKNPPAQPVVRTLSVEQADLFVNSAAAAEILGLSLANFRLRQRDKAMSDPVGEIPDPLRGFWDREAVETCAEKLGQFRKNGAYRAVVAGCGGDPKPRIRGGEEGVEIR